LEGQETVITTTPSAFTPRHYANSPKKWSWPLGAQLKYKVMACRIENNRSGAYPAIIGKTFLSEPYVCKGLIYLNQTMGWYIERYYEDAAKPKSTRHKNGQ
jgi:hypothetical protein